MIAWLIETLLATSLLMLVVLLVRNPVRRAFGSAVAYALWALPVLRFALPPLPGFHHLSDVIATAIGRSVTGGMDSGIITPMAVPPAIVQHAAAHVDRLATIPPVDVAPAAAMPVAGMPVDVVIVPPLAGADGVSWMMLALVLWAVGAVIFVGYQLIVYRRFCARIERQAHRRHRIAQDRVEIIETDAASGPLAFGIWRKVVAFPSDFAERYDQDERDLALAHELTHHARGDLIANWVALVVLALHWFNPIAWRAFRAFRADQEMACDARVLAGQGADFAHAYGRAIVKSAHGRAVSPACHLHTINDLKGRLKMLSKGKLSQRRVVAGSGVVAMLVVGGLGLSASGSLAADRSGRDAVRTVAVDPSGSDGSAQAPASPAVVPVPPVPPKPVIYVEAPASPATKSDDKGAVSVPRVVVIRKQLNTGKDSENAVDKDVKVIIKRFGGKDGPQDMAVIADLPETISMACKDESAGGDGTIVMRDEKEGKQQFVFCTRHRIKLADNAGVKIIDSREIERKAYRSAVDGLRSARERMAAKGGAGRDEGLKAIDEAIAELESDLAKVN